MSYEAIFARAIAAAGAAGLALTAAIASAQEPGARADGWGPSLAMRSTPTVEQQNGVRYLTGGVSLEERDQMRSFASGFDLRLMFSGARSGQFLADVEVTIRDARGREVLVVPDSGPLLFAALPSGNYSVTARYQGRAQTRAVSVQDGRVAESHLTWPDTAQGESS